jgi:hypothetical protein
MSALETESRVSYSKLLGSALLLMLGCTLCVSLPADAQNCDLVHDCFAPDSVYYQQFSLKPLNCSDSVELRIPVYMWCDGWASIMYTAFQIVAGASYDTAFVFPLIQCPSLTTYIDITQERDDCGVYLQCWSNYVTPSSGIFCELLMKCHRSDTVRVTGTTPRLGDSFSWWDPLYVRLDTTFVVPSQFTILPGDVNSSGQVSISDAVFLISYVFAGGCAPYDLNAADVNGNCTVSISDAVYLINYIFAGGNAPLPGCVAP